MGVHPSAVIPPVCIDGGNLILSASVIDSDNEEITVCLYPFRDFEVKGGKSALVLAKFVPLQVYSGSTRDINDVYAGGQIAAPLLHLRSLMRSDKVVSELC